jgi:CRISPR-associated protein Csy1
MGESMVALVRQYIQGRADARLEKLDKETEKAKKDAGTDPLTLAAIDEDHTAKHAVEAAKYQPRAWLSSAAVRAKQISFATHPIKFTHTDAKGGSSVYAAQRDADTCNYLTTAALVQPAIDVDGNAAALDVAGLLQLELDGISLASMIAQNDMSALAPFAENESQRNAWCQGFQQAMADKDIRSHTLAKQLYVPVGADQYHLISPLFASSLAQALYQRIADSRYTDAAKATRKLRKENKYSDAATVDFVKVAVQTFGGTKPQNVSQLNSRRGGKAFLLSCEPPAWGERLVPPITHQKSFWNEYGRRYDRLAWRTAKALKKFLLRVLDRDSNKPIRDQRASMIDELIDILFQYAAELQNLTEHAGWSEQSKLTKAEQFWLDPHRDDAQFQADRASKDWQQDIANQFAAWLNHQLKDDKLVMKDVEYHAWSKLLKDRLARLKDDLAFDKHTEASAQ